MGDICGLGSVHALFGNCSFCMSILRHPLFLACNLLYLSYYLLKQSGVELPWMVRNYFSDLVCLFLINAWSLWIIRKVKGQPQLELSAAQVFFSFLLCTVLFEFVLPNQYSNMYTQDYWDVLCYFLGALLYYFWRKRVRLLINKQ